jgi:hypothetical protein
VAALEEMVAILQAELVTQAHLRLLLEPTLAMVAVAVLLVTLRVMRVAQEFLAAEAVLEVEELLEVQALVVLAVKD